MGDIVKNIILSVFAGFGGTTSLFLFFKFIIKKWIEESIKNQMDKSLALFEQKLNRQDSVFNIRIQKEFAYYDKIQVQNGEIKVIVTESMLFLLHEDINQFYASKNRLKRTLKEVSESLEANRAYLDQNLLDTVDKIKTVLGELLQIGDDSTDFNGLDKIQYEKKAKEVVTLANYFNIQLREYIASVSNISE